MPDRTPSPVIIGLGMIPFGIYGSFLGTVLPFLLTKSGIPLDRVAGISAAAMSPTFWGFLLTPIVDVGLTRRAYVFLTIAVSTGCMVAAILTLSPQHLLLLTALLVTGELSIVLFGNALAGWVTEFMPLEQRGAAGGWINVANLGAGSAGAMLMLELSGWASLRTAAIGAGAMTLFPAAIVLLYPKARPPALHFREIFTGLMKTVWTLSKTRNCLIGFALFLSPLGAAAAMNLFSGLGMNYHASANAVIWITGAGNAITSSLGAILGGYLADRVPRRYLYLASGLCIAACGCSMAFAPLSPMAFSVGVLAYAFCSGIAYAAFTAFGFELAGAHNPVASTQLALFGAAANASVVYMTWGDGQGFHFHGARGLLLTDACAAFGAFLVLFVLVRRAWRTATPAVSVPVG